MAVHTYLMDFTVGEAAVGNVESKHRILDSVEKVLKEYLPELRREQVSDLHEGFLMILVDSNAVLVSVRGYKQGIVTVNIEHFKPDDQQLILPIEKLHQIESTLKGLMEAEKSRYLPAIKRGGKTARYFLTADERILEYDIDKVVFEKQSPYQKVQIVHSVSFGNLLILDELQNMSESDLIYTESLMRRGVNNYENKEIIILGGGDGCLLWELLKENPKFVTMLELDEVVMKACAIHLRSACGNCLDQYKGEKYEIIVGDCFLTLDKFINQGKKVDFVFGDLTDIPVDSSGEHTEAWDFVRKILNKSIQVLRPGGRYLTHGNGSSVPKSLEAFEKVLGSLDVPVEFTRTNAFVPSFLEDWVFYEVVPKLT